jgi:hypothetical protein
MNQEKFKTFSEAYKKGLLEAVTAKPEDYFTQGATPEQYAEVVGKKMLDHIGGGRHFGVSYDSTGFKKACKALGIKHTRKAILEYLEIPIK